MYSFLVAILLLDAVILATAVLLQAGQGGGMAATFGGVSSACPVPSCGSWTTKVRSDCVVSAC